jgi:hypothetical protein
MGEQFPSQEFYIGPGGCDWVIRGKDAGEGRVTGSTWRRNGILC